MPNPFRTLSLVITTLCSTGLMTLASAADTTAPKAPLIATTAAAPVATSSASNATNTGVVNPIWQQYMVPPAPDVDAKAFVLMDDASGMVIGAKNPNLPLEPASLTKLMTAYLVFNELAAGRIHLTDEVAISKEAWKTGGSRMFAQVGAKIPLEALIQGSVIQSGNDATVALAEYVGGTEAAFVEMMNHQAQLLGMKDTHYMDASGLPAPNHVATAYDLALLAQAIINNFPQYYHYFGEKWFVWNNIRQPNRNRLLWRNINVDGLKTGHTDAAGFCLISSAKQGDSRFISVVMGAPTEPLRVNDSQALLNYAFRYFQSQKIYNANDVILQRRVWGAKEKMISLGVKHDFAIAIPRNAAPDLKVTLSINPNISAPIVKNQQLGSINVYVKDQLVASQPLVALADNARANWFARFMDAIAHFFSKLFGKSASTEIIVSGPGSTAPTTNGLNRV
jgi:D-alanyl-D-alanine carboxypeptidase (penicillin-binding protein 5/6)